MKINSVLSRIISRSEFLNLFNGFVKTVKSRHALTIFKKEAEMKIAVCPF